MIKFTCFTKSRDSITMSGKHILINPPSPRHPIHSHQEHNFFSHIYTSSSPFCDVIFMVKSHFPLNQHTPPPYFIRPLPYIIIIIGSGTIPMEVCVSSALNWFLLSDWRNTRMSQSFQSQLILALLLQTYFLEAILDILLCLTSHPTPHKGTYTSKLAVEQHSAYYSPNMPYVRHIYLLSK
jgi:hypothetical protein